MFYLIFATLFLVLNTTAMEEHNNLQHIAPDQALQAHRINAQINYAVISTIFSPFRCYKTLDFPTCIDCVEKKNLHEDDKLPLAAFCVLDHTKELKDVLTRVKNAPHPAPVYKSINKFFKYYSFHLTDGRLSHRQSAKACLYFAANLRYTFQAIKDCHMPGKQKIAPDCDIKTKDDMFAAIDDVIYFLSVIEAAKIARITSILNT